jgi:hypothetical protein
MTASWEDGLYIMRLDAGHISNSKTLHASIDKWFLDNDVNQWFLSVISKPTDTPNYSRYHAYELEISVYDEQDALKFMLVFGARLHRRPINQS